MKRITALALLAGLIPAVAAAEGGLESSGYAAEAILKGEYRSAEAQLEPWAAQRDLPALVNLAEVYHATGRGQEATALYRTILAMPAEQLATGNGWTSSSHTLARAGLKRATKQVGYASR